MSKSSTASQSAKIPTVLPTKSAWARGPPPNNTASTSSSRSQSPAPSLPQTSAPAPHTHSRRPSTLSGQAVPIKDGVSIPRTVSTVSRQGTSPVTFGSIDDAAAPLSSSPAATPTPAVKGDGVKSFGSIAAAAHSHSSSVTMNGKPPSKPPASATPPPTTTSQTPATKPATAASRPKFDVKNLFRGAPATPSASSSAASTPVSTSSQQLTPSASSDPTSSPSVRPTSLPQHAHAPNSFTRNASQNGPNGPPRSPVFPRGQVHKPTPNGPPMSPSLANRQMAPPTSGLPPTGPPQPQPHMPGMPPPQQSWMYYPQQNGMPDQQQYMQPQYYAAPPPWGYMPQMQQPGPPGSPMGGMAAPLSSPPQQPPMQQQPTPGTPKLTPSTIPHPSPPTSGHTPSASVSSPPLTPNPRLNTAAPTFVPGGAVRTQAKVVMKRPDGNEVDLESYKKNKTSQPASPAKPPIQLASPRRPPSVSIRIEAPDDRAKRLAEEKEKEEKEKKAQLEKEEAAKKIEQEAQQKAEAEKKAKEEKERQEQEEKQKLEDDRKRKESEEAAKAEAEKVEKEKAAEEERLRQKLEEEVKERKAKADKEAADAAAAAAAAKPVEATPEATPAPAAKVEEKEEGEISAAEEDKGAKNSKAFPTSTPSELRRRPGPLDLSSTQRPIAPSLPSAISTARIIEDLGSVSYPDGIKSPQSDLNVNAKDSKFRYDRDFLMQFMEICKEKPDSLPPLEAIGLEPQDPASYTMTRGGSGRHRQGSGASISGRQASLSSFAPNAPGFGGKGGFNMGQFTTPGAAKLSSEDRFSMSSGQRSVSTSSGFGGRPPPMVRTASQGAAHTSTRTRSKRGTQRPGSEKMGGQQGGNQHHGGGGGGYNSQQQALDLGPVAPLQATENRWDRKTLSTVDPNSPEIVERKVKSLLNKLTMEKFDLISDQIIEWANKSENEKDGRTLIQVIKLVFEKATDEATWSEMYARLCRKMMEMLSIKVQDDGIKNAEGKPITGGQLFRKYLLNRCQEDFEHGWINKESTAAAAKSKAAEDDAVKTNTKEGEEEIALYSEEYYIAQKAKRRGLGLIKFIGELFKLQMLTERIMHECVKKLLGNVDNPEEEEIESLCKLLATVGSALDNNKARAHMDVYFQRMKELTRSSHVTSRMQFMLQDVIEMRERRWVSRNAVAAPSTIAEVREKAEKEKAAQEKESYQRTQSMSRGGSRRGGPRGGDDGGQVGPDGWSNVTPRAPPKAGDLSKFGQISKGAAGPMTFGPSSVFLKDKKGPGGPPENKRDSLSRSNSTNMFAMLNMGAEQTPDAAAAAAAAGAEPAARRRLVLQPRSKPAEGEGEEATAAASTPVEGESNVPETAEMSEAEAKKTIDEDLKEFFAVRDLGEAEIYYTKLPSQFHGKLIDKLAGRAIESKAQDAQLVADFFALGASKSLASPAAFEEGLSGLLEFLDDIVVDAPKAVELMAVMMKGPGFSDDVKGSLCAKSAENGEKLLGLLSS